MENLDSNLSRLGRNPSRKIDKRLAGRRAQSDVRQALKSVSAGGRLFFFRSDLSIKLNPVDDRTISDVSINL